MFNKKTVEQQRADPSLPQRYQSGASKTEALAGSVFKKLVTKVKDRMLDPFASVHPIHVVDHMYFFARKWRILSKFLCFAMESSHRRLKRMLCNSGGLSLLCGRLGVQVVVDNHTIDDSLRREG